MVEYSDMPPLVEAQSEAGQSGIYRSYAGGTPFVFPAAPPTATSATTSATNTPWSGPNQLGWSPYGPPPPMMMAQWPPQAGPPWSAPPHGAFMTTPVAFPALANPAMPAPNPAEAWPPQAEDQDWVRVSGYFNGKQDDPEGWPPSGHTGSPFSSNTSSPSSMNSNISRSRSLRSVHDESVKRPPREWRADFSMARSLGLSASLGSMFTKARSPSISSSCESTTSFAMWSCAHDARVVLDSPRSSKLNSYIRYSAVSSPMFLDLRKNPSTLRFRELERAVNPWDLTRFACEPPVASMRLYNVHFPWHIDVESSNPAGVTLHDLFSAIWLSMMTPISQADWWNNEMDEITRERISRAWADRCADDEERQKGVRRVDFLMDRCILHGLEKGKDGMWEMKVKRQ